MGSVRYLHIDVFQYVLSERVTNILELIDLVASEKSLIYIFFRSRSISYSYNTIQGDRENNVFRGWWPYSHILFSLLYCLNTDEIKTNCYYVTSNARGFLIKKTACDKI